MYIYSIEQHTKTRQQFYCSRRLAQLRNKLDERPIASIKGITTNINKMQFSQNNNKIF